MTPTLGELRAAIKTTLETAIPDLTVYDIVPDTVNLPAAFVLPVSAAYDFALRQPDDTWLFDVTVLVSSGDNEIAQNTLDDFISSAGDRSLRQVITRFQNLGIPGGSVRAHIANMSGYGGQFEAAGVPHIGATLRLEVTLTVR